jgi:outer membrane protein insertion porin family
MEFLDLKIILVFILLIFSFAVRANTISCEPAKLCPFVKNHFDSRFNEINKENVLLYAQENSHISSIAERSDGGFHLKINFASNNVEIFSESSTTGIIDSGEFRKIVSDKTKTKIDNFEVIRKLTLLENFLKARGYKKYKLSVFETNNLGQKNMFLGIRIGPALVLKGISFPSNMQNLNLQGFVKQFKFLEGKPFNQLEYRIILQDVQKSLVKSGYLYSSVSYRQVINDFNLNLEFVIELGPRVQFTARGNKIFTKFEITSNLSRSARTKINRLNTAMIIETIEDMYKERGFYFTNVFVRTISGKTKSKRTLINYYINIEEGRKLSINSLSYFGNKFLDNEELTKVLNANSSDLVANGFFDESSLKSFKGVLIKKYQENGYVDFSISGPEFVFINNRDAVDVSLYLKEGKQYIIDKFNICDCEPALKDKIESVLVNKEKSPINVHEIDDDFKKAIDKVKDMGFYYATINDVDERVEFDTFNSVATINYGIKKGAKTKINKIYINGLEKTKDFVVKRELFLTEGDYISPNRLKALQKRINSLSLFQTIKITPIKNKKTKDEIQLVDIIIDLKEKDFGSGELALGYRTDIGARAAFGILYNNFGGRNWIGSIDIQSNYRFNFSNLDRDRVPENTKFIEFGGNAGFTFPYLNSIPISTSLNLSYKKQRFYGFDAKILRFSYVNSYNFLSNLGFDIKYQFETIDQFEATEEIDNDSFKIGSVTPSINLDLRDRAIAPTKGAFFQVSWEFANPVLGAQEGEELTINYNRLMSRNKFYIPISQKLVWANSYSFGVATNFANKIRLSDQGSLQRYDDNTVVLTGYIPSIRVFRLDGQDTIRGFTDEEINQLDDGRDVGEVIVTDKAYLQVIKSELRYSINDNLRVGVFFDAGSIKLNEFNAGRLRTSTGITSKFVTPVGSLDLDFGVKSRRRRFNNGTREQFGRLHFSIGFF